ncbi:MULTISPECIES: ABC transporter ATP-binding protein [Cohnella]|uniref:ABC transporter ATP-binding protein n=1 Tax=Cohnella TaxID=329857 RepID=UPI00111990AA|nr:MULTISPECIES: ABC transporter ATP-binding protein [Cohnella]MBN2980925.1 ABC transporter ATP-binding protein [Cohnella algarum]
MQPVIQLEQLRKQYGQTVALDGITMQVNKGEIFGVVGPNGAGKTTLIEILEGLRTADGGEALVLGKDIRKEAAEIKQRIGVLFQATTLPEKAKVKEVLRLFASFYKNARNPEEIARLTGLQDKGNAMIKSLSGGWKQRVALALALINDPEILFLDEPSMGLDPNARKEMWATIRELRGEGRTIVVTTHYMEEAEQLCDRVAIISKGRLVALETPSGLIAKLGRTRRIRCRNAGMATREELAALPHVLSVEMEAEQVVLHSDNMDVALQHLYRLADRQGWLVSGLKLEDASMNEVFMEATQKEATA